MGERGASPIVVVKELRKVYRQRQLEVKALQGIDLEIAAGEWLAITGASGSGKSTLLHLMGALDLPSSGTVQVLGLDISRRSDDELAAFRRQRLGFVFQFFNLLPTLSARENVALPLLLDAQPRREALARAGEMLERVGLGERGEHRPDELSGGQQQRVALARSLVTSPELLLADEPTGNLDSQAGAEVLRLLEELRSERNLSIVLVTHDESVAARASRRIELLDGRIARDSAQTAEEAPAP